MDSTFNIMDYLGKSIVLVKESPYFLRVPKTDSPQRATSLNPAQACDFEEAITRLGTPKGVFHTCKEKGFQAFTIEGSPNIDFVVLFNQVKDRYSAYPFQLPFGI